jgi:hypothetical protein
LDCAADVRFLGAVKGKEEVTHGKMRVPAVMPASKSSRRAKRARFDSIVVFMRQWQGFVCRLPNGLGKHPSSLSGPAPVLFLGELVEEFAVFVVEFYEDFHAY